MCRWALIAAFALILCAIPAAAQEPRMIALALANAKAASPELTTVAGRPTLRLRQGEVVILRWTSAQAATLHLHGYNIEASVGAGASADMRIDARATGRFPVETHGARAVTVMYLEVRPN